MVVLKIVFFITNRILVVVTKKDTHSFRYELTVLVKITGQTLFNVGQFRVLKLTNV
jgi:hypothetical protein